MKDNSNLLNKLLKFTVEILKGRYGISDAYLKEIELIDEEKNALKESFKILNSKNGSSLPSNFSATFGMQGKDCDLPLKSIFSEIYLSKRQQLKNIFIYPDLDKIPFPQLLDDSKSVISQTLKSSFLRDYKALCERKELNNNVLLLFIEKYGGFLPVNSDLQTMPFYDYVKILGAIFISLLAQRTIEESPPLMLIGGDLSGIQDFIFSISSKGALKSYRARSFYLGVLVEHTVNKILENFNLSDVNIVYSSGGGFLILAPNVSEEVVVKIRNDINKWLFDKFRGLIYLSVTSVSLGKNFEDSVAKLANDLEVLKARKFSDFIKETLEPKEPIKKTSEDECQICYNDLDSDVEELPSGVRACKTCRDLFNVGGALGNAKYVLRLANGVINMDGKFEIEGTTYSLTDNIDNIDSKFYDKVWIINSFDMFDFIKFNEKNPSKLLLGNYLTKINDLAEEVQKREQAELKINNPSGELSKEDTASFLGLALSSIGIKRLATLRMDVDSLGTIFSRGIRDNSLAKISAASRLLDYYFKYYMNWICAMDKNKMNFFNVSLIPKREFHERQVSIIYSGGDDLLIVGAWNEVVELAYDIERTFSKFVCENPDITISSGFSLLHHKFPFDKAQKEAKNALEYAKDNHELCEAGSCRTSYASCPFYENGKCSIKKDSVTMFYDLSALRLKEKNGKVEISINWSKAEEVKNFVNEFIYCFGKFDEKENTLLLEGLPRLFIRKLLNIFLIWARKGGVFVLPLVRLMNDTERTLEGGNLNFFVSRIEPELTKKYFEKDISIAHTLLKWIEFLTRTSEV